MNELNLENAVIIGGSGMVGSNIPFGKKPSSLELNIRNSDQVNEYFEKCKDITCIIHLVSMNLRDSENNPIKAIDININGMTNILNIAKKLNIPFVFISSGAVFSSFNPNMKFSETTIPSPNCIYGATKYAAEKIALTYDKTIIIRTGWLFGGNQKSHYKFVDQTYNNMINNNNVICCNDFYGSTTYVVDLINKMKDLILNNMFGIHHVVNNGISTGVDIGELIANLLQKSHVLIDKRTFTDIPNSGPKRSSTEVLISNNTFNILRDWKLALAEYVSLLNSKKSMTIVLNTEKKWERREMCRLCNSNDIIDFFNLEPTPPANHFIEKPIKQETIPLDLAICKMCKHIQLREILDPTFLYLHYFYVSSTSGVMTKHLKDSVIQFTRTLNLKKDANILEIGANDGVCIKELLDNGFVNILGIDPSRNIHSRHNLPILCDFFGSSSKDKILSKYTNFKLIYAFHCMAHIEDIQDVFKTIYELLENDGVFIMEVGYFYEVFKTKQFDVIYHEHIDYHTCTAIHAFSRNNGLYLFDVLENKIQGGSIQFYFTKNKELPINNSIKECIEKEAEIGLFTKTILDKWQFSVERICIDINCILNSFINSGKKIAAYGASAKSTTFLHQLKISQNIIKYIVDDNLYKQNFYTPGLHIPVKSSETLSLNKVDYIIILSCNFADEIITRLDIYRKAGLRVIIPFPEIKII
jgi:dTDP-4-dehydrorhamnose reductase/SAM-dependent methyltransferase